MLAGRAVARATRQLAFAALRQRAGVRVNASRFASSFVVNTFGRSRNQQHSVVNRGTVLARSVLDLIPRVDVAYFSDGTGIGGVEEAEVVTDDNDNAEQDLSLIHI